MAGIPQLQKQFLEYAASLFNEEILNEQFIQVQRLKPEDDPNFVMKLAAIFFEDAAKLIKTMSEMLERPIVNFTRVYHTAQQLRGSSATVGAGKMKNICSHFHNLCDSANSEMLRRYVEHLHCENSILKSKLDNLFRLENQIQNAGGVVPQLKLKTNMHNLENVKRM